MAPERTTDTTQAVSAEPRPSPEPAAANGQEHLSRAELLAHLAAQAWCSLGPDHPVPARVGPAQFKRSARTNVYRLEGVAPGGGAVIAKRCRPWYGAIERIAYEEYLTRLSIPTPGYLGCVEAPEQKRLWIFMRELTGERFVHDDSVHRAYAARWLGALHVRAREIGRHPGLPGADPRRYLEHLRHARKLLDALRHNSMIAPDGMALFETFLLRFDELERGWDAVETVCASAPQTLVHGDFNGKNMFVQGGADPGVVVFDWEFAGWGAPAVDLAQIAPPGRRLAANPDLGTYWEAVRDVWPELDREAVERLADCGTVFRVLAVLDWEASTFVYEWAPSYVPKLRQWEADLMLAFHRLQSGARSPARYEGAGR